MDDTISRQAVIARLDQAAENWNIAEPYHEGMRAGFRNAARIVLEMPSAQTDRKKGRWIPMSNGTYYKCSECGYARMKGDDNFCKECGTDMRKRSEDGQTD